MYLFNIIFSYIIYTFENLLLKKKEKRIERIWLVQMHKDTAKTFCIKYPSMYLDICKLYASTYMSINSINIRNIKIL